jgi:hypothetical protein
MGRKRPERTARRAQQRAARQLVRDREKLAGLVAGGSAERPIDVGSAAVVEVKARALPCIQCGGELELRADRATSTPRGVLRELALTCRRCHASRAAWFLIAPSRSN